VTIYSFDDVIRMPKSIHSVPLTPTGDFNIPLWRPVPWIAFIYFIAVELVFVIAAKVPVLDLLSQSFAPAVYYFVFPVGVVWFAFKVELEGLKPHAWVLAYLLYLRRPKRVLGGDAVTAVGEAVAYSGRVRIWWDLDAPRLHDGWVTGGRVRTTVPVRFAYALRHRKQVIRPDDDRGRLADHEVEGRLQVRP
jgi:hypothetical protein